MEKDVTQTKKEYADDYSHNKVIPSMAVKTVKPDENGDPNRAK